jgi:prepilin-type N-terminal cleavage/methylation domain-containing protein/prepilin-type processing-associated H-X9-DG protein
MRRKCAFTLVELLVVIGIIALLVGILLPVLGNVRKQANATKCATALREIGNAMQLYALENKGFLPCAQVQMAGGQTYNVDGVIYPNNGVGAYWFTFLAKYVTKNKIGTSSTFAYEAADARKSIIWGCPEWQGYFTGTVGEYNRVQTGLGMNDFPTFTENYPTAGSFPPRNTSCFIQNYWNGRPDQWIGNWQKQTTYGRKGPQRCLVADSQYWLAEAEAPPTSGPLPGQKIFDPGPVTYSLSGQTMIDVYRHGKYPKVRVGGSSGFYNTVGGKVAFNVLYCDGHVNTESDRRLAYKVLRMKFPG